VKHSAFETSDLPALEPTTKVGLLATVSPEGLPHVSLITSIQAKTPRQLMWGQFTEGLSKKHVRQNPKTAFLMLTVDRKLWRGKASYTHAVREGDDYVMFNSKPMFRYNAYFGIHTVHYMDLVETGGREALPLANIAAALVATRFAKAGARTDGAPILTPWGRGLFDGLLSLKFIAWVDADGYPTLTPLLPCQCADRRRLVFSPLAYGDELRTIPAGAPVAIFGMTMQMENILVRGIFSGFRRHRFCELGVVDVDWVYNSMPPKMGQIYPPVPLTAVVNF
jgi:hypothetical protein